LQITGVKVDEPPVRVPRKVGDEASLTAYQVPLTPELHAGRVETV
jgi:hypothetical protein